MIDWSDLGDSVWLTAFLIVISALVFAVTYALARVAFRPKGISERARLLSVIGFQVGLPLGFVGLVAGFLTGTSRESAVSALVPAILTFIGLLVAYMVGKGTLRAIVAGYVVFVFTLELLLGTVLGSRSRDRYDEALASVEYQKHKADQELAVRLYRGALGLPLEAPKPVSATEEKAAAPKKP